MARPVEIDRAAAFDAGHRLFWERGYGGTSLADLLAAMDISRSSFYAAFGSKRALYEAVLARYAERTERLLARIDSEAGGLDALHRFLTRTIVAVSTTDRRRGCLFVNAVVELEAVDPELHHRAVAGLDGLRAAIDRWLRAAAAEGALRRDLPVEALAAQVDLTVKGLRIACREGAPRSDLSRRIDMLLTFLAPAEHARP